MIPEAEFANCVKLRVKGLQYGSLPTWDLKEITKVISRLHDNSETSFPEVTKRSVPLLLLQSRYAGGWSFSSGVGGREGQVVVGFLLEQ